MKKTLALLLAVVMLLGVLAGCGPQGNTESTGGSESTNPPDGTQGTGEATEAPTTEATLGTIVGVAGEYTYRTSVSTMPANWNPHVYQTSDDAVPLDYITDSLYTLVFNDELHPAADASKAPYESYTIVPSMAADFPVDVTEAVKAEHPEFGIPENATSMRAWQVTLRDDLKWEDGTPIVAQDFVDSLERVLRPELLNYRAADNYTGSYVLVNAKEYSLQGKLDITDNGIELIPIEEMTKNEEGQYTTADGKLVYIGLTVGLDWCNGNSLQAYVEAYGDQYFGLEHWDELLAMADDQGLVPCTDDTLALLATVTTTVEAWGETEDDLLNYLVIANFRYEDNYSFDNVGLFATDDHTLTFVFKNPLDGFYLMIYGMSTSYLVKTDLYDSLLKETETAKGTVWSSTYNTSIETSPSYGPYKISQFQTDKSMHFVKNENWQGWNNDSYYYVDPEDGQTYQMYQTTDIDIQYIKESETRKQMFLAGQLLSYGMQSTDFDQYRNSSRYYASPAETIFFLIVNGNGAMLDERETHADFDATTTDVQMQQILAFRQALAISVPREEMAATVSPQRSGGYAMLGNTYIYDPDTVAYYRETDEAKQVLCDFYSIDVADYNGDLDAAVDAITGYDPETAAELFQQAYEEGLEKGYITDNDGDGKSDQTVTMIYAMSSEINDFLRKTINFLNESINKSAAGSGLEGKIEIVPSSPVGNNWPEELRAGTMDTELAGWSGSVVDPFHMADTWTNPDDAYWTWWNPSAIDMTLTIDGEEITMSVRDWALCLNSTDMTIGGKTYNFGYNMTSPENRLKILAAIEGQVLGAYVALPIMADGSGALLSHQVDYIVEDYVPMMGRGGIAYMKYNYDDSEWFDYVASQGGILNYA